MRKIRELGSLPSDAFDKYQGLKLSEVLIIHVIISNSNSDNNNVYSVNQCISFHSFILFIVMEKVREDK